MLVLLGFAGSVQAAQPHSPLDPCNGNLITAGQFAPFSAKVWNLERWQRGKPGAKAIDAYRHKLRCAAGPGHRRAMQNRWGRDRLRYGRHRHHMQYCRSGEVISGRVSWFNGPASTTASGTPVSEPGLAVNIAPGTTSAGWLNSTTLRWMAMARAGKPQMVWATTQGHTGKLPIIDLGPHESTGRAIDYTEAALYKLGFTPSSFITDALGSVKLIPPGCE